MITLDADNRYVYIRGADRPTIRALERATSYLVQGFMHSMAFKLKRWDGREHLMQFKTSEPSGYRVPFGLLGDVIAVLDEMGKRYKLEFARRRRAAKRVVYEWNSNIELRPYQQEAIKAVTDFSRWDAGRGILKMPIRSGKTKTAAKIIHEIGARTLFIVTSQMLLYQTKKALDEALGMEVGAIGDSGWTEGDVTVAMIQTLGRARGRKANKAKGQEAVPMDERYRALIRSYDLIIFDECHHLRGDVWHQVFMDFDAPYKIGLSATVYFDNKRETEKGVIWLKACCGDIRADISTTRLIQEGYLMRPTIRLYRCEVPDLTEHGWSATLRNEAIYENEWRNTKIARLVKEQRAAGLKVLVVTNRLNQVALLADLMDKAHIDFETITGNDDNDTRQRRVKAFVKGDVGVLIGTVFGEGVDIPEIECVINAEGGRDVKATVQRMRNLTPSAGKTEAVFIDFIDVTNGYFAEHTAERVASYRSESAFQIKIVD